MKVIDTNTVMVIVTGSVMVTVVAVDNSSMVMIPSELAEGLVRRRVRVVISVYSKVSINTLSTPCFNSDSKIPNALYHVDCCS